MAVEKVFIQDRLEPSLILASRSISKEAKFGPAIRGTLGSYTNHNGLIIKHNTRGWMVAEAVSPMSTYTSLSDYEDMIADEKTVVRVWRVIEASDQERVNVGRYWQMHLDKLPYANYTIAKLAIFRIVNSLPWRLRIRGVWCTDLVFKAWRSIGRDPFPKPNGGTKHNPTPRTLENRLVAGVLEDVTDKVLL
jgi:hypothetical protein